MNNCKKRKHCKDDDDWINVTDDEEEDIANGQFKSVQNTSKLTIAEKENLASRVSSEQIFTQDDFKRIKQEQLKKKLSDKTFLKNKKQKLISIDSDNSENENQKTYRYTKFSAIQ